jgi:hypothetical protein
MVKVLKNNNLFQSRHHENPKYVRCSKNQFDDMPFSSQMKTKMSFSQTFYCYLDTFRFYLKFMSLQLSTNLGFPDLQHATVKRFSTCCLTSSDVSKFKIVPVHVKC